MPDKLNMEKVIELAKAAVGSNYEDTFNFVVTFLRFREVDRHLRDLNEMRHDMEWISGQLSGTGETPQRAVLSATLAWLEEEAVRHKAAIARLRTDIISTRKSHPKAVAAAELAARPTFGAWLEVSPRRSIQ